MEHTKGQRSWRLLHARSASSPRRRRGRNVYCLLQTPSTQNFSCFELHYRSWRVLYWEIGPTCTVILSTRPRVGQSPPNTHTHQLNVQRMEGQVKSGRCRLVLFLIKYEDTKHLELPKITETVNHPEWCNISDFMLFNHHAFSKTQRKVALNHSPLTLPRRTSSTRKNHDAHPNSRTC